MDIFEKDFKLTYKKNGFQTTVGGIITLLMGIGVIILVWYFGQDIYLKRKPFFLRKELYLPKFPFYNITNENFFYAVRIEDDYNSPRIVELLNPEYFEFFISYFVFKSNTTTGEISPVSTDNERLTKCNSSHITQDNSSSNLVNFLCAPSLNYTIGGNYMDSEYFKLPVFTIKKCSKATENEFNIKLTSANSINWVRLLPQISYSIYAYMNLVKVKY